MITYFPGLFGFCPHLMTITATMMTTATATVNITSSGNLLVESIKKFLL